VSLFSADVFACAPGGAPRRLSPGDGVYYQPCVHPFGSHVVYAGAATGPPRIWLQDLRSGATSALTPADSGARHPVFSADGARIAFTSDRDADVHETVEEMQPHGLPPAGSLFAMDPDGGRLVQLTRGPACDQRPCFHPDGRSLVFVSSRAGGLTLWRVPADGSAEPTPLPYTGFAYRPWLSPDGGWLYFFRDVGGRHRICRLRPECAEFEPLPNDDDGMSHGPFADPGGEVLLVHTTRGGAWGLWELPLDGSPPRRLATPGVDHPTHGTRARDGTLVFDAVREPAAA
jgi:TolB protein